jgi:bacteriocin biosynthesis cyclodehydratase domain-containing protein
MAESPNQAASRDAAVLAVRYAELDIPPYPRLAPWLVAVDLGDDRLQLRSSESVSTLAHPLLIQVFRRIRPLLDGRHTVDEISASAGPDVLPTTVHFLLKLLKGRSLLQSGAEPGQPNDPALAAWSDQLRFLSHFADDAAGAQRALAAARVGVVGAGELSRAVTDALVSIGVDGIVQLPGPASWPSDEGVIDPALDAVVACADATAFTFFEAVNRGCLRARTRWLRVAISATSAEIGPTTVPYQTACYTCLDLRRRTHEADLPGYDAYRSQLAGRSHGNEGGSRALLMSVAGQAALEVMRLLTGFTPPATIGRYVELSAATPLTVTHDVLKVPRCPSCDARRSVPEAWDRGYALIGLEL